MLVFPETFTVEELNAYFEALRRHQSTYSGSIAWVVDVTQLRARSVDAKKRRMFADYESAVEALHRKHCAGVAVVMKNQLQRGLVTAVYWMTPPAYRWATFVDRGDAITWARKSLTTFGPAR